MLPAKAMLVPNTLPPNLGKNAPNNGAIEFMFNPSELAFEGVVETSESPGARSQQSGKPKVGFSHIKAYTITIKNIVFDTYETGKDVEDYINKFKMALSFTDKQDGGKEPQRPPVYTFSWGGKVYLKSCFIEKLSYRLTLFLPDGTPVRAVIDSLTLKEAEEPKPDNSMKPVTPDRNNDSLDRIKNKR